MKRIKRLYRKFVNALQYFKIAWYGKGDITLALLRQAEQDGNWQSYTLGWIGKHYFSGDSVIRSEYKNGVYTLEITETK